jgi:hypothetical protein
MDDVKIINKDSGLWGATDFINYLVHTYFYNTHDKLWYIHSVSDSLVINIQAIHSPIEPGDWYLISDVSMSPD